MVLKIVIVNTYGTQDTLCDFVFIAKEVDFYFMQKQFYFVVFLTFQSSIWHLNIVLSKDEVLTLVNIFIANPTWGVFFVQSYLVTSSHLSSSFVQIVTIFYGYGWA